MDAHRRLKIGEVAARTGLTPRALRYYEELGLLEPADRGPGGQRRYDAADVQRLYRICLLRQLGTPLGEIGPLLADADHDLGASVRAHIDDLDARLAALGRLRERVGRLAETLTSDDGSAPSDRELLAVLTEMNDLDSGLRKRLTLLVYDDIVAAHDHLVSVFGLGPGPLSYDDSGRAVHGVVVVGDGLVWLHPSSRHHGLASPRELGAATCCMAVFVDDVDEHHARAVAAGAEVVSEPRDMDYGVREYDARDLEGGLWSFMTEIDNDGLDRDGPDRDSPGHDREDESDG